MTSLRGNPGDGQRTVQVFDRATGHELPFTLVDHGHDFTVYVDLPRRTVDLCTCVSRCCDTPEATGGTCKGLPS